MSDGADIDGGEVDVTVKASKMGWVPLEKFKGAPEKWTDAETFVRRGEEIMPILRKNNEKLSNEIVTLRSEFQSKLNEAQAALTEFQKYHEEDSKRQYERALEKLKSDKKEALSTQDYDAVVEIDEAMKILDEQKKSRQTQQKTPSTQITQDPTQHPEFQQWQKENSDWYGVDKERTAYATAQAAFFRAMNPNLVGREFLDKVTEEVEQRFGLPNKEKKVDRVEGSRQSSSRNGGAKSYADLPPDAKASCDKFGARLTGEGKAFKTMADWRKQYVRDYFGE
jgi:hypothetical protein